jgi:hypothetical protein
MDLKVFNLIMYNRMFNNVYFLFSKKLNYSSNGLVDYQVVFFGMIKLGWEFLGVGVQGDGGNLMVFGMIEDW